MRLTFEEIRMFLFFCELTNNGEKKVKFSDVLKISKKSVSCASQFLIRLQQKGLIEKVSFGYWALTEKGVTTVNKILNNPIFQGILNNNNDLKV